MNQSEEFIEIIKGLLEKQGTTRASKNNGRNSSFLLADN